jgi:branched-chain amino acid transport system permease protein
MQFNIERFGSARAGACAVLALAGLALPLAVGSGRGLHQLTVICIYGIVVYGLGFLYSVARQLSVAHATLWGIAAYVTAFLALEWHVSFWLCLPLAMAAAAVCAGLIGYPSLRVKGHYFLIMTFAFSEIARVVAINWRSVTNGDTGLVIPQSPEPLGPISLQTRAEWYYFAYALLLLAIVSVHFLKRTALGKRLAAIGENDALAESCGVNATRDKLLAFMISGLYAGAAGACWAFYQHYVNPDQFGSRTGIEFILMLLLGGHHHALGPLVGVVVALELPAVFSFSPQENEIALGVAFIAIILLMPQGIAGAAEQGWQALARRWKQYRNVAAEELNECSP